MTLKRTLTRLSARRGEERKLVDKETTRGNLPREEFRISMQDNRRCLESSSQLSGYCRNTNTVHRRVNLLRRKEGREVTRLREFVCTSAKACPAVGKISYTTWMFARRTIENMAPFSYFRQGCPSSRDRRHDVSRLKQRLGHLPSQGIVKLDYQEITLFSIIRYPRIRRHIRSHMKSSFVDR